MFIHKNRKLIILVFILVILSCSYFIPQIKIQYNLRDFLPENDEELEFCEMFYNKFNVSENMLLVGIESKSGIFNLDFLNTVDNLTRKIRALPFVLEASSITTLKQPVKTPLGIITIPVIHVGDEYKLTSDSLKIIKDKRLMNWYVSKNLKSVTIQVEFDRKLNENKKDAAVVSIEKLLKPLKVYDTHLSGNINTELNFKKLLKNDMIKAVGLSTFLMLVLSYVLYRSIRIVLIIFLTVGGGLIFLYGFIGFTIGEVSIISMMFPTLILIVGMSDFVHIYSGFLDNLSKGEKKINALQISLKEIGFATFLTSLTTAIGFLALIISTMKPIRVFGINAAIGVMVTFMIAFFFSSSLILLNSNSNILHPNRIFLNRWSKIFDWVYFVVLKYPGRIMLIFFAMLFFCLIGIMQLSGNSNMISNIKKRSKVNQDYLFFEQNFAGVRSFELSVQMKMPFVLNDIEILRQIDSLHNHIDNYKEVGILFSPATIYKSLNKAYYGGIPSDYHLPAYQVELSKIENTFNKTNVFKSSQLINTKKTHGRVVGWMKDIGRVRFKQFSREVNNWITEQLDTNKMIIRHTGSSLMYDRSDEYLVKNMFISLALAIFVIGILIGLLYKDIKMVIISIIPNIFPLLVMGAVIGFLGIKMHGSLAIIFTIGFVIAIDDTIHFLSRVKLILRKGNNIESAIYQSIHETGKPILITTIILFFGAGILIFSGFKEIYYYGIILTIAGPAALVGDLIILPLLIRLFVPR